MTNEERIKAMPEEELAHFLSGITGEIGYDLDGAPGFHEYVDNQICLDQKICPISGKTCLMNQGVDDSCPYEPWQRIQFWLSLPSKESN